jgi:hypothetical protein
MNFLCRFGWHRPAPTPRWHAGFYFTKCLRCGSDLVRMPRGRWRIPADVLILWSAHAGASARAAVASERGESEHAAAAATAPSTLAASSADRPSPAAQADAARPGEVPPLTPTKGPAAGSAPPVPPAPPIPPGGDFMDEPEAAQTVFGKGADTRAAAGGRAGNTESVPSHDASGARGEGAGLLWLAGLVGGMGLLAGALLASFGIAAFSARSGSAPPGGATAAAPPLAIASGPPSPVGPRTIVTAAHPGCSGGARGSLRRRPRAAAEQQVHILEEDGHWVTLTRAGTPCWTLRTGRVPPRGKPQIGG